MEITQDAPVSPAQAEKEKGQSYSAQEQELIHQLVQARLSQKEKLEYEDLDGYELPPRTQFSMLKKPAVSIKYGQFTFNMASIRLFEGVQHILPVANRVKRRLAVITCAEEESGSVEWARIKNDAWVNKTITSAEYVEKIFAFMGWDRSCRYKVLGRIVNSRKGLIMVFDLQEAIMFTPAPEEFVDKRTGEVKKRRIAYYPDVYKDRIGRSYNDYEAAQQLNMFEDLDGYTGQTYGDAPADPQSVATPETVAPAL